MKTALLQTISRRSLPALLAALVTMPASADDPRRMVELPEMMQEHMLTNMRDHLAAIDGILAAMAGGELDQAAEIAERRLGMSSLDDHGAHHMAKFMPQGMRDAGTGMHRAASRFAVKAQEGDQDAAMAELARVTAACVACHSAYRVR